MRSSYLYLLTLANHAVGQATITITQTVPSSAITTAVQSTTTPSSFSIQSRITTAVSSSDASSPAITSVSECHMHSTTQYCVSGVNEYRIRTTATKGETLPTSYAQCHSHDVGIFCEDPAGKEVEIVDEAGNQSNATGATDAAAANCHEHFGVLHCVGGPEEANVSCQSPVRNYNVPLRIGLVFVILLTSMIGVFGPILLTALARVNPHHILFTLLKQFGTGIIISTAFVHLYTHATLQFESPCLGELAYESTTAAIVMAGLFIAFLADYLGARIAQRYQHRTSLIDDESSIPSDADEIRKSAAIVAEMDKKQSIMTQDHRSASLNVTILEAGIIFHSILIGITLVVASDTFFITLFIVILFHQMFEGIALGSRIAALPARSAGLWKKKIIMAGAFGITTPIGMAIGIGVLSGFNGNDPSTIIAIGVLNGLSAGILIWIGVVEMWAGDWIFGGDLRDAGLVRSVIAFFSFVVGLVVMSVLGKWA